MKKSIYTLFFVLILVFVCLTFQSEKSFAQNSKAAFYIMKQTNARGRTNLSYAFPVHSRFMEQNFSNDEVLKYKFYLIAYVGALRQKYKEKEIDGTSVSEVVYFEDVDCLGFSILFENNKKQKLFFEIPENTINTDEKIIKKGIFLQKIIFEINFPLKDEESAKDFQSICLIAIDAWAKECNISTESKEKVVQNLQKTDFVYDFSIENGIYFSKNMYKTNGLTHNVFVKSLEEIKNDNKIEIYLQTINKANVYLFVTIVTCLGMAVAIIVIKTKEKHKK